MIKDDGMSKYGSWEHGMKEYEKWLWKMRWEDMEDDKGGWDEKDTEDDKGGWDEKIRKMIKEDGMKR